MTEILMDVDAIINLCPDTDEGAHSMRDFMMKTNPDYRRTSLGTKIALELSELGYENEAARLINAIWFK